MKTKLFKEEITDSDLWNAFLEGDKEAFGQIYRMYIQDLFRFGCSVIPNEDLVMDCIQEVFVDLWKYHSQLPTTERVKFYLFKCLSNKIHHEVKKNKKIKFHQEKYIVEIEPCIQSCETELIQAIQNQSLKEKLSKALEKLPLRQKEAVNCLFFEKFTYEETAKIMNINLRSAYTLAWKAISSLKNTI